ncbi:MAG TPA: hypothetical protein DCW90_04915 [Lachnospiraceae bacterium]|nr:hypothetical protein [Lachnospiraceae bacterium]
MNDISYFFKSNIRTFEQSEFEDFLRFITIRNAAEYISESFYEYAEAFDIPIHQETKKYDDDSILIELKGENHSLDDCIVQFGVDILNLPNVMIILADYANMICSCNHYEYTISPYAIWDLAWKYLFTRPILNTIRKINGDFIYWNIDYSYIIDRINEIFSGKSIEDFNESYKSFKKSIIEIDNENSWKTDPTNRSDN